MKRFNSVYVFLIACLFIVATSSTSAQAAEDHPAPDVNGNVWMKSTEQEKKAFLFGAGSAIVLEYHIKEKHSEEPSRFVKGWVDGLKDISWTELASKLDSYYKNNPDKMQKHVFEVIWHEIIKPNLKS